MAVLDVRFGFLLRVLAFPRALGTQRLTPVISSVSYPCKWVAVRPQRRIMLVFAVLAVPSCPLCLSRTALVLLRSHHPITAVVTASVRAICVSHSPPSYLSQHLSLISAGARVRYR